jgi:ech hydrogenase subunit C
MSLMELSRRKSPWVLHAGTGGCNGCDIEVLACLAPRFDISRFGVVNTGNPKHADIMLVTGPVTLKYREILKNLYDQMPDPKAVVAVGSCACTGGIYQGCYATCGSLDKVLPVDVYVPGCNVRPEAVIDGLVLALDILNKKKRNIPGTNILNVKEEA